jgi:branched-chain amino acid transport system substrate-binding protein
MPVNTRPQGCGPWRGDMRRLAMGLVLLGLVVAFGCGSHRMIVGVIVPESGTSKVYGPSLKAGIKLAFDQPLAKGIPGLEPWYRDSMSHPEIAEKTADELFKAGARIIIGGVTSDEARSIIPSAERAKGVLISPSASEPGLAASSNLFFRVYPSDDVEATEAVRFLVNEKKVKTLMILFQKGRYAEGLLPVFTAEVAKLGATITGQLPIGPSHWDQAINDALPIQKPDAVFICAYSEEALAALQVLRTAKYSGQICATSAIDIGDVVRRAGEIAEGIFVPLLKVDLASKQEPVKSFVEKFRAANGGKDPDIYAAHGYDAALTAIYALQGPPLKTNEELLQRLMSLGDKQGVTGRLSFDHVGNSTHIPRMHVFKSGKFEDCDPRPTP